MLSEHLFGRLEVYAVFLLGLCYDLGLSLDEVGLAVLGVLLTRLLVELAIVLLFNLRPQVLHLNSEVLELILNDRSLLLFLAEAFLHLTLGLLVLVLHVLVFTLESCYLFLLLAVDRLYLMYVLGVFELLEPLLKFFEFLLHAEALLISHSYGVYFA